MRAAKVQASLRIRAVSPEPLLLAHTSSESRGTFRQKTRSLAPLNDWACAVEICHDGMLEDTNSLDGAQIVFLQVLRSRTSTTFFENDLAEGLWENCHAYKSIWGLQGNQYETMGKKNFFLTVLILESLCWLPRNFVSSWLLHTSVDCRKMKLFSCTCTRGVM